MDKMKEAIIKVEGINKTFVSTKAVIDMHLEVSKGEVRGLIGENGSGKSTLSSMIAGSLKPDSGIMYLMGKEYNPCLLYTSLWGMDFLRMYDYERTRGIFWQIDFHLPAGSHVIYACVRIMNDHRLSLIHI